MKDHGIPFFVAVVLCWFVADAAMLAFPYGSTMPPRVVTVYVCCKYEKDQARIEPSKFAADFNPRSVQPIYYVAVDRPPAKQAAETRKRRK